MIHFLYKASNIQILSPDDLWVHASKTIDGFQTVLFNQFHSMRLGSTCGFILGTFQRCCRLWSRPIMSKSHLLHKSTMERFKPASHGQKENVLTTCLQVHIDRAKKRSYLFKQTGRKLVIKSAERLMKQKVVKARYEMEPGRVICPSKYHVHLTSCLRIWTKRPISKLKKCKIFFSVCVYLSFLFSCT